jgi:hypothetical protein
MRVLVCGGRHYHDEANVYATLDRLKPTTVIEGGATGADFLANAWSIDHDVDCETYYAEWKKFGRSAGAIRNQRMLTEGRPDLVVAFPGGKGTADMVRRATNAGIKVEIIT